LRVVIAGVHARTCREGATISRAQGEGKRKIALNSQETIKRRNEMGSRFGHACKSISIYIGRKYESTSGNVRIHVGFFLNSYKSSATAINRAVNLKILANTELCKKTRLFHSNLTKIN
jgi:hypothetical protein